MRMGIGQIKSSLGALGAGGLDTLAATVQRVEGYYPPGTTGYPNGSLAYRNNNPGNLRFVGQPGGSQGEGGYASFPSYATGYQALLNQILAQSAPGYRSPNGSVYPNGQTLSQFINQYAPVADNNNTSAYLSTLVQATGYPADTLLSTVISGGATAPPAVSDDATDSTTVTDLNTTDAPAIPDDSADITPILILVVGAGLIWAFFGR